MVDLAVFVKGWVEDLAVLVVEGMVDLAVFVKG